MRRIETHEAFVPLGCADAGVPAVSLGAGTRWLEAYQEVTVKHGRYVQGGGCTSVGAAGGFMQGGGFGSWSRKFGIAAASMLEAEVVTADGRVLVANRCQNQDLLWALRGGGGGTFGVVTRVTLMTHPLPDYFGGVVGVIKAKSDEAFLKLLRRFVDFYRRSLSNEHWGEKISVRRSNAIELSMFFEAFRATDAEEIWKPFRQWVERRPQSYTMTAQFFEVPGRKMWNESYFKHTFPNEIRTNPQLTPDVFWWAANQGEVATYWYAYESRWIPETLFSPPQAQRLAHVLFAASRHWPLEIAFNKGQAGAAADALRRDRETSMNPEVMRAGALVIIAARGGGHPAVRGHEPDIKEGEIEKAGVTAAMRVIRDATPRSGSYVNETNYFERDWKRGFWGDNYARLLAIKHKYDPDGIFLCHHCVGSDEPRVRPRE